ncbi:MAG: primosomal protein N' [Sphingobacteriaceae bacterium]|nr:primosomal protein N' [Sphingobacteriaceae bacterium]
MEKITLFTDVIVPMNIPAKFTYRVPEEMNEMVVPGKRVLVQFGKTKIYTGIIYKVHQTAPTERTAKYLDAVLDDFPIVTETQLKFWDWISFYYCAAPGDVMNAALPSGLKLSSTSTLQLNPEFNFEETEHSFFTDREHELLDLLHLNESLSFEDAAAHLKIKSAHPIIHKLIIKNAIVVYEEIKDKYKPKLVSYIQLSEEYKPETKLKEVLDQLEKKAFKQAEALLLYFKLQKEDELNKWIKKSALTKSIDNSALNALIKKGILTEEHFETGRLLFEKGNTEDKKLSEAQQNAYEEIQKQFLNKKTVLLHGVTGSGKTEIYIQLIKDALLKNQQILYLVPEIALTTQLITRLRAVFGESVGVYHSRFSENERVEIWNNILIPPKNQEEKQYKIIIGARSALFLPYQNLGLIIVDEEHDASFKQHDPAPRYHARDAALYLATIHQSNVLLGSATPSIESWVNCKQEKYIKIELPIQFAAKGGTQIEIYDTKLYHAANQNNSSFTPPLFEAINLSLQNKEQIILFQNRRGFAPYTECKQCAYVPQCVQCDVSLIYHKQNEKLTCHYCGYTTAPPSVCPSCNSPHLVLKGMGTEKIEEEAAILLPKLKLHAWI